MSTISVRTEKLVGPPSFLQSIDLSTSLSGISLQSERWRGVRFLKRMG